MTKITRYSSSVVIGSPTGGNMGTNTINSKRILVNGSEVVAVQTSSGNKNYLINPDFNIWQRGTSFNTTGYTADRWRLTIGTGAAVTVSRQEFALGQTDVPNNPRYFLRVNRTTAGSTPSFIEQRIEDVRNLSGNDVCVSFWAKASKVMDISLSISQNFGTGGSPSSQVNTSIDSVNLNTTWSRYFVTVPAPTISGKTVGTNNNDYISVLFNMATSEGTGYFDISNVKVENSTVPSDFQVPDFAKEEINCNRYYQLFGLVNNCFFGSVRFSTTTQAVCFFSFEDEMRDIPTISLLGNLANDYRLSDGGSMFNGLSSASPATTTKNHTIIVFNANGGTANTNLTGLIRTNSASGGIVMDSEL